ncbi:uncharacterized protein LOC130366867 isoform X2 [Hyla sarda]|uniref:uncharacterized protein LOC130366867 isoform X2 n=1 Tax=Hyla sarda TaxID=327740 RepID=UPI0024C41227|nr:uncharacterized protein LOC130366867 isoform X2 [Hyla sarda]
MVKEGAPSVIPLIVVHQSINCKLEMGQCPSNVITDILNNIQKVLIYDPVTFFFIAVNIIYKLFVWAYLSEKTTRKTNLQFMNCITCKNKECLRYVEPSLRQGQSLNIHNVQTSGALKSATMKRSIKKCILGRSVPPENVFKVTTGDTLTSKSAALNVKTDEMKKSKSTKATSTYKRTIDGHLKLNETKFKEINQLLVPPVSTNSQGTQESGQMINMPGLENQEQTISSQKWSVINVSKLRIHFLRKFFENLTMTFPEIVQKSVQMYNESAKLPTRKESINASKENINNNGSELIPRTKNDTHVLSLGPLCLNVHSDFLTVNNQIQRSKMTIPTMGYCFNDIAINALTPIQERNYNTVMLKTNFKRWKRPYKEETDLPIGNLLHIGIIKIIQTLSPEVCIYKSSQQIKNSIPLQLKKETDFLEPGIKKDGKVPKSKLQTPKTKNKMEIIESNRVIFSKAMMPPHVTSDDYSNSLQEPKLIYNSKVDGNIPITMVRENIHLCPDENISTQLFQWTDPRETSTARLPEVFTSFKSFLLKTMKPRHLVRRLHR